MLDCTLNLLSSSKDTSTIVAADLIIFSPGKEGIQPFFGLLR